MSAASPWRSLDARPLVNGPVDYLLIGGLLSMVTTAVVLLVPGGVTWTHATDLAWLTLLANSAHFASSTVRLYAKPGARETWPWLTQLFPLAAFGALAACLALADVLGPHLQALYLTWSPFHYAAQAYGLAVVYGLRAGLALPPLEKRLLWWTCMLPFFATFVAGDTTGLGWLVPSAWLDALPHSASVRLGLVRGLGVAAFAAPVLVAVLAWRRGGAPLPLLSLMPIVSNALWFVLLGPRDAFVWATIFHGLQYLAIVTLFHVKDQLARPDNVHGAAWHATRFYGASLALGYALFNLVPLGFVSAGFGMVESLLLTTAAINLHHFVVDAFIWRFRPADSNRRIAEAPATA